MNRRFSVTLEGNVAPYTRSLDQATERTNRFAGQAERAGDRASQGFSRSAVSAAIMGGSIRRVAETATGFFAGSIFIEGARRVAQGIKGIVLSGSDLNETINKAQVTFGSATVIVTNGADVMARKFGIAKNTFIDAASSIGLIGKAAGLSAPQAATMSTSLTKLAADATSFFNVPLPDVLSDIRSGLVGEVEPLRKYGALLSESAVQQEALRLGLVQSGDALTDQEKVMARVSLIQKALAVASGDLENTQGGLANRLRAIVGHVQNWAASMGQRAQPAVLGLLDASYRLGHDGLELVENLLGRLQPFFSGLGRAGEAIVPIFRSMVDVVAPLAKGLGAVAGTPVVAALNALGSSLGALAGFLARNEGLVKVLTAAFVASLLPAVGRAIVAFAQAASSMAVGAYRSYAAAVQSMAVSWEAAGASMRAGTAASEGAAAAIEGTSTASRAANVALGGLRAAFLAAIPTAFVFGLSQQIQTLNKLRETGKDAVDELRRGLDFSTPVGFDEFARRLHAAADAEREVANGAEGWQDPLDKGARLMLGQTTETERAAAALKNYEKALGQNALLQNRFNARLAENVQATGLNEDAVLKLAKTYDVDLTTSVPGASRVLIEAANTARSSGQVIGDTLLELSDAQKALVSGIVDAAKPGNIVGDIVSQRNEAARAADQQTKASQRGTKATQDEAHSQAQLAQAYLSVDRAQRRVIEAQGQLDDVRSAEHVRREVEDAEERLQEAYDRVQQSIYTVIDATRALEDARRREAEGRAATEAEFSLARAREAQADAAENVTKAQEKLAAAQDHGTPDELAQSQRELNEALRRVKETAFDAEDAQVGLTRAQQDQSGGRAVAEAQAGVSSANREAAQASREQVDAQKALNDLMAPGGTYARELADAENDLRDALAGVQSAQEQVAQAIRGTGNAALSEASAGVDAFRTEITGVDVSLDEFIRKLEEHNQAAAKWAENLAIIARRGGTGVAKAMEDMGIEAASQVAQMANATDADFKRAADAALFHTLIETTGVQTLIAAGLGNADAIAKVKSGDIAQSIASQLGVGVQDVGRIMGEYFPTIAEPLNRILAGIGKPTLDTSAGGAMPASQRLTLARGGVVGQGEHHVAQVAAPGTWRVWAEDPKSGREAYVPERGDRGRGLAILGQAAGWYGARVVPFAAGGITLPYPPDFATHGNAVGYEAQHQTRFERDIAQAFIDRVGVAGAGVGLSGPGGTIGSGWPSITAYLSRVGVPYTVTSTTGGHHAPGSFHYQGKAVDLVGDMGRIFGALAAPGGINGPVRGINELFYDPAGYYYDEGRYIRGAIGGHRDHVHAATFDQGGWLPPHSTGVWQNGTGWPERVLSPTETAGYQQPYPQMSIPVHQEKSASLQSTRSTVRVDVQATLRVQGSIYGVDHLQQVLDGHEKRLRRVIVQDLEREIGMR